MALRDIEWHRPGFRRGFPHRCRVRHWRLAAAAVSLSSFSIAFAFADLCDQRDWFSRRAALLGLASLAGEISRAPAQAAIPMMEEFYQGSGSQVALPKEELQAMERAYRKAWEKQKSLSITEAASGALTSLNDVPQMLKSGDFDGVRTLLLSPSVGAIGILKSPSRVGGSPYGAWATQCGDSRCESSALIARGALQELEEWCFSKRAIYFNSADKKQVESRDATGKALQKLQENLEEPLEFLEQAKVALEEVASQELSRQLMNFS